MAENETMEGKEISLNERIKKEVEIVKQREMNGEENVIANPITIGGVNIQLDIKKDEKENSYKIHILGVHILTLDENDELSFKQGWENELREQIKNNEDKINGEDLINELKEMELQLEKEKQKEDKRDEEQIDEDEKDEEDLSEDMDEKDEEENGDKEKSEDEAKKQIAKRHNVNPNQIVHVSMDRRITDNDNFPTLAKWAKGYNDIYILPGKDEYSWETIGINKDGEEEVINNRQQEGKNPNVTIKRVDGKEITEVRPIAMYEIDNKTSYAVIRDSAGKTQMLYCRQEAGDGKAYWGIQVPEAEGKNIREKSVESREFIDSKNNSSYDLSKKADELEKGTDLEERGIPSKGGKGVQVEEIEGTPAQNRLLRKEDIIKDLLSRDGIIDRATAMPGFYENKAEKVLRLMESDDKITYKEAVERVEKGNREQGGRTPDEKPNKREH